MSGKDVVSLDNSDPDGNAGFSNDNSQPAHYGAILAGMCSHLVPITHTYLCVAVALTVHSTALA